MASEVRFERVLTLPAAQQRKPSTFYLVADSDQNFVELYLTGNSPLNVRRLPTRSDVAAGGGGGTGSVDVGDLNNLTTTDKTSIVAALNEIAAALGAQIDWSDLNGIPTSFPPSAHSHTAATDATSGFMSAADKLKLDGIAAGAQVNVPTNLSYVPESRSLNSSTGDDAVLPLVTDTNAGLAPASGGGTTKFLRADGEWVPPGTAISHADATLQTDVTLELNNIWYNGPSISLPPGRWMIHVTGHYRRNATTACNVAIRASDGTVVYAHGETYHPSVNGAQLQITSFGIAELAVNSTITLQMMASSGSLFSFMKADTQNNPQGNKATRITAIRLAP